VHLREYFSTLCSQDQFDRWVQTLKPQMRGPQHALAGTLLEPSAIYRVLDTTLIPAVVRGTACCERLLAGQAFFGRRRFNLDWVYIKVALMVSERTLSP
jgi:hypothetical protein